MFVFCFDIGQGVKGVQGITRYQRELSKESHLYCVGWVVWLFCGFGVRSFGRSVGSGFCSVVQFHQ